MRYWRNEGRSPKLATGPQIQEGSEDTKPASEEIGGRDECRLEAKAKLGEEGERTGRMRNRLDNKAEDFSEPWITKVIQSHEQAARWRLF